MFLLRKAAERGLAEHGWLTSYLTFSFADYHDARYMGFRALRVINEDRVQPGRGFGAHSHRDMEIISYVLEGQLQHRDSIGTGSVIRPGDVQRMSAGRGVTHSEFNASASELVHFLQIWLVPNVRGIAPSYEQKSFAASAKAGRLCLVASPDGRDGSLSIHAEASLYAGRVEAGQSAELALAAGRHAWIQVTRGNVAVRSDGSSAPYELSEGDGAAVSETSQLTLEGRDGGEVLMFELG
jgi:redox-sensitive bicupin YhaK (pirin superfamily)